MGKSNKDSLIEFPCEFPIKAMGSAGIEFEALVVSIVRKHAPKLSEAAVDTRHSKNNRYVSVTVTITAESQTQLDAIYHELSANKKVLMVL